MKTSSKLWLTGGVAAVLMTVAGCSDSSNDDGDRNNQGSAGPATVPDNTGTTVGSFIAYLKGLDSNDEKSEPLLIKDGFTVPPDESSDSPPPA